MRKLLLVTLLALGPVVAQADNGMFYVGAGVTNDNLRDIAQTNSNLDSTSWKVWTGVRPINMFAVEADYIDLGSQSVNSPTAFADLHYKAVAGYAVGYLPLPLPWVDVFGKVGLAYWTLSGSAGCIGDACFIGRVSDNGSQFAWGAGGQVHFGNLGARLEYESFSIRNTGGANLVSLSVFLNLF
jgi:Outer membrane protein beta-barrel domain